MTLIALSACAGGGTVTFDDSAATTDDSTATTDDTSATDDTGEVIETGFEETGEDWEMNPDYVYFTQYWGVDGKPISWVNDDGSELPPLALVYYYDERYFDAGDDRYVCFEYFQLQDPAATDHWGDFQFDMSHVAQWTDDPCDFGAGPMEGKRLSFGVGLISEDMKSQLKDAIESNGDDFSLWEPYLMGSRVGEYEVGWSVLLELDENRSLVPGDNCPAETACREAPEDPDSIPGPSVIWGSSWYLASPDSF